MDAKSELRRRLLAARRAVPPAVRNAETVALTETLTGVLTEALTGVLSEALTGTVSGAALSGVPPRSAGSVCAYWPVGSEPGSPGLPDALLRRGCRVLLPVVIDPVSPLNWAEYSGVASLRAGPFGVREPTGPLLGCAAIAGAVLVLVPALAVDRHGVRIGRGGGYYDRTLPLATPDTPLVAVVRDDELLDSLPAEPHDVLVNAALTPGNGLLRLPR